MHAPAPAAGVLELIAARRPDLVAISGDMTQRAKPGQFREAREWVQQISESSLAVPTLTVPGNHDVPLYRVWERFFAPLQAYRNHFSDNPTPVFEDDELFVLGLNSARSWAFTNGRVGRRQRQEAIDRLAAAPAHKIRLVVVHHSLLPTPRYGSQQILVGARAAVDAFAEHGVEAVLSGHRHQTAVTSSTAYYPKSSPGFLVVQSGTTTSHRGRGCEHRRCTCNWLTVDQDHWTIECLLWQEGSGQFEATSRHVFPRSHHESR